jgi:hypothetical protein
MHGGSRVRPQVRVTPRQESHQYKKSRQPTRCRSALAWRGGFGHAPLAKLITDNKADKSFQHCDVSHGARHTDYCSFACTVLSLILVLSPCQWRRVCSLNVWPQRSPSFWCGSNPKSKTLSMMQRRKTGVRFRDFWKRSPSNGCGRMAVLKSALRGRRNDASSDRPSSISRRLLDFDDVRDAAAQNASPFAPFLNQDSPTCVLVSVIEHAAQEFRPVKLETFRFIQAFYVAIRPISRELPPGNRAELATDTQGNVSRYYTCHTKTQALDSCALS